ncbi:tetratricopeptide repeat protein [Gottfriedia acidiceleris]|uniref:tetratricopeptide repeat protein n=1 Tax=Gottfriedia acidiceleris TaxID=371036 RepID=UPI00300043FF
MKLMKILGCIFLLLIIIRAGSWFWIKKHPEKIFNGYFQTTEVKKGDFYTFHYDSKDNQKVAMLNQMIPSILEQGNNWYRHLDLTKKKLHIYLSPKKIDKSKSSDERGRYLENVNVLYIRSDLNQVELKNTFAHEMAHYLFSNYVHEKGLKLEQFPYWIHEGMASSFAQKLAPIPLDNISEDYQTQPLMNIKPVKTSDGKGGYKPSTYLLMMFAVEYLIYHHDEQIVGKLVTQTRKKGDFSKAFKELTSLDLKTYHTKFNDNSEKIRGFETLISTDKVLAEKQMQLYLKEQGDYFINASLFYNYLGNLYISQGRYSEALDIMEKQLEFQDIPSIYQEVAKVAVKVDHKKAVEYAEESVESAKRNNWNVEIFQAYLKKVIDDSY